MPDTLTLPHDGQIEQALISCVLRRGKTFPKLASILKPGDFYHEPFKWAWDAFTRITENGLAIDALTFADQLRRDGHFAQFDQSPAILGQDEFTTYSNAHCGTSAISFILTYEHAQLNSAESYAQRVKQFAGKRRLVELANQMADWSYNGKTPAEIVQDTEKELIRLSLSNGMHLATVKDTRAAAIDAMESAERRSKKQDDFIKSAWEDMNNLIGEYERGNFHIFAGRPGMGKTVALVTEALNMAQHGKRVFIWSGEMSARQYTYRFFAQIMPTLENGCSVEVKRMKTGAMSTEEWSCFYRAGEYFATLPIWIDETAGLKIADLKTLCRRQAETGLDIIFIDHAGLLHADGNKENRTQEVNYISRSLKEIAKELDKPLVAAVQLNRKVEDRASKEPQLADLKESGNFEEDASIIAFIFDDDDPTRANIRHMKIAKNRDAPVGQIDVLFNGQQMKFETVKSNKVDLREI